MIRVRFEHSRERLSSFLLKNRYPYTWTLEALQQTLPIRLSTPDDEDVGYLWCEAETPTTIRGHVCIAKDWQGRWATRQVIRDLMKAFELLGATKVIAHVPFPRHQRLLLRAGWSLEGNDAVIEIPNEWTT